MSDPRDLAETTLRRFSFGPDDIELLHATARELLSTLGALEAANKERAEALTEATNVRLNLSMSQGLVVGTESLLADANADLDRFIAFVQRARPLLGMAVANSLGAQADELLASVAEPQPAETE